MAFYRVFAKNKEFNGARLGVGFAKGEAICDNAAALDYFKSQGYKIEPADEAAKKEVEAQAKAKAEAEAKKK
jgi:hypothetical protein